jgi:hypothetical protein
MRIIGRSWGYHWEIQPKKIPGRSWRHENIISGWWFQPLWKNISQLGWLFPTYGNIKIVIYIFEIFRDYAYNPNFLSLKSPSSSSWHCHHCSWKHQALLAKATWLWIQFGTELCCRKFHMYTIIYIYMDILKAYTSINHTTTAFYTFQ